MANRVAGEQYYKLTGQLFEIARQLRQKEGYPYDPELLSKALQDCIEGYFQEEKLDIFEYFTPLADADVPAEYQATLDKYRKLAAEYGVAHNVPLCYRVRAGFTLKRHAPQAGPCYKDFRYIQDRNFEDKPTEDCLVFWVPRLVEGSTSKTVDEQRRLLSEFRRRLELPEHHLSGFGEAAPVAGLILAHFKATGERVPLDGLYTRTDICYAAGDRLGLGNFGEYGLGCDNWYWDARRYGRLGIFALGMEPL